MLRCSTIRKNITLISLCNYYLNISYDEISLQKGYEKRIDIDNNNK